MENQPDPEALRRDAIIGVAGLGTMGLGIAQVFAAAGFQVLATDGYAPARANAAARLQEALAATSVPASLPPGPLPPLWRG